LYFIAYVVNMDANIFTWTKFFFHNALILLYIAVVWFMEKPSKLTVNR